MKINFELDTTDRLAVKDAYTMIGSLVHGDSTSTETPDPVKDKEEEEPPAPKKRKRRTSAEVKADKERKAKEVLEASAKRAAEEAAEKGEEDDDDLLGDQVTFNDLKALVVKKIQKNRAEIKEELTNRGADKLTNLAEDQYQDFHDFLNGLK